MCNLQSWVLLIYRISPTKVFQNLPSLHSYPALMIIISPLTWKFGILVEQTYLFIYFFLQNAGKTLHFLELRSALFLQWIA